MVGEAPPPISIITEPELKLSTDCAFAKKEMNRIAEQRSVLRLVGTFLINETGWGTFIHSTILFNLWKTHPDKHFLGDGTV